MPKPTFCNLPEEKRRTILDAAIEVFAESDYRDVSVARIATRAGIAKGSIYQYFENKKDLYLYLIRLAIEEKQRFLQQPPPESVTGVFDWLRWAFQAGLDFELSNPRLAQVTFRAFYGDSPLPKDLRETVQDATEGFIRQLVARGMEQGEIDTSLDADLVYFVFDTTMTRFGDYLLRRLRISPEALGEQGGRALDVPEVALLVSDLIAILERGLRPTPQSRTGAQRLTEERG